MVATLYTTYSVPIGVVLARHESEKRIRGGLSLELIMCELSSEVLNSWMNKFESCLRVFEDYITAYRHPILILPTD